MANDQIPDHRQEQRLLDASRKALDESIANQEALQARLDQARETAMQAGQKPPATLPGWTWAGGLVAAGLAAVVFLQQPASLQPMPEDTQGLVLSMAELDDTEWDLVQDFDFALWLSELEPNEMENLPAI